MYSLILGGGYAGDLFSIDGILGGTRGGYKRNLPVQIYALYLKDAEDIVFGLSVEMFRVYFKHT